jgi:2-polyprenyl-6-methoxyphenol hydroxylase-like FAD-dependent oxidoreductase
VSREPIAHLEHALNAMAEHLETDVLIVGGGPVGLTLAMDLAWRGIEVVLAEKRERGEPPEVKCNHVAARSMEIFRRLGIVERVRNAGLPADYPNDVAYRTTTTGIELARIPIPSRSRRYSATGGPDTGWPTPEPPHRINQIFLEPVLFECAAAMADIRILNRVEVTDFAQADGHVTANARHLGSGEALSIRAAYMVGCDGGRSAVRKAIGGRLQGDAVIQRVQSTYFRAPALIHMLQAPPAWGTFSLNPRRSGNVYAIDGRETWLLHNYLKDDEPDFDSVDRDWSIRQILGVGDDFQYEIISNEDWYGRRLVADKLREGHVFICGDAAHLWVPYAGYGMNAGIADAENLAWMLAAHLNGWAPPSILDAHEAERLPITEQVSHFAMDHAHAMASQRRAVPERIEEDSAEGRRLRAELGHAAYDLNVQQYCAGGLNFGYYYDASPIIAYDGTRQPGYTMAEFTPSTVPGCRTPHIRLADGTSLYDRLGRDFTLLRFDPAVDVAPLCAAAARVGLPLTILDVPPPDAPEAAAIYREKLVLSRPDRHVAWRGDALPPDPAALIDRVRGAGRPVSGDVQRSSAGRNPVTNAAPE